MAPADFACPLLTHRVRDRYGGNTSQWARRARKERSSMEARQDESSGKALVFVWRKFHGGLIVVNTMRMADILNANRISMPEWNN